MRRGQEEIGGGVGRVREAGGEAEGGKEGRGEGGR